MKSCDVKSVRRPGGYRAKFQFRTFAYYNDDAYHSTSLYRQLWSKAYNSSGTFEF